jgi:hypothetical protein
VPWPCVAVESHLKIRQLRVFIVNEASMPISVETAMAGLDDDLLPQIQLFQPAAQAESHR